MEIHKLTAGPPRADHSIVYFTQNPLSERDFERFGIRYYLERGFQVTVFDVSRIMFPGLAFKCDPDVGAGFPAFNSKALSRPRDILLSEDTLRASLFVVFFAQAQGPHSRNLYILRCLKRLRCRYVISSINITPFAPMAKTLFRTGSWVREAKPPLFRRPSLDGILRRLPLGMLGISAADFVIYDGRKSVLPNPLIGPRTTPLFAHTLDYEKSLAICGQEVTDSETAVFLDQYVPYHPDMIATGLVRSIDADSYYGALRRFFDQIENELGLSVVVSCHPRSDYSDKPGLFGDRRMISDRTTETIRSSRLVIGHCSTSLSLAALWQKPVLIVATRDYYFCEPAMAAMIEGYAWGLGKPVKFITPHDSVDLIDALEMDTDRYRSFVEDYIKTSDSPDQPFWEIVTEGILTEQRAAT